MLFPAVLEYDDKGHVSLDLIDVVRGLLLLVAEVVVGLHDVLEVFLLLGLSLGLVGVHEFGRQGGGNQEGQEEYLSQGYHSGLI